MSDTKHRSLIPGLTLAIARAAIGAAVVALAVYLALAPERIEHFEAIYQFESQQVQDPDGHLAPLQKRFDELAADEQKTGVVRKQVEREFGNSDDSK